MASDCSAAISVPCSELVPFSVCTTDDSNKSISIGLTDLNLKRIKDFLKLLQTNFSLVKLPVLVSDSEKS